MYPPGGPSFMMHPLGGPPVMMHPLGGPPLMMPPLGLRAPPTPPPGPLLCAQPLAVPPPRRRRLGCAECKRVRYSTHTNAAMGLRGRPRDFCAGCLEAESEIRHFESLVASGQHRPSPIVESPDMYDEPPPPYNTPAGIAEDDRWGPVDAAQSDDDIRNYAEDGEARGNDTHRRRAHTQGQGRPARQKYRSASSAPKARAHSQPAQSNERRERAGQGRATPDAYERSDREPEYHPRRKAATRKYGNNVPDPRYYAPSGKIVYANEEGPEYSSEPLEDSKHTAEDLEDAFETLSVGQGGRARHKLRGSMKPRETEKYREHGEHKESHPRDAESRSKPPAPKYEYSSTITIINGIEAHPLTLVSHDVTKGSWRTPPASTIETSATDRFKILATDSEGCDGEVKYKLHNGSMMKLSFTCSEDIHDASITPKVLRNLFRLDFESKIPLICTVTVMEVHSQAPKPS